MHGGGKNKSASKDSSVPVQGPLPVESASDSLHQAGELDNTDGAVAAAVESESSATEESASIEVSDADIELISEGQVPEEAEASPPAKAGGLHIVWQNKLPDDGRPAAPASEEAGIILEILNEEDLIPETDAVDIEITMDDDAGFDSREALAGPGETAPPEAEDDWLGVKDINRFISGRIKREVRYAPSFTRHV